MFLEECAICNKVLTDDTPCRGIAHTDVFYCDACFYRDCDHIRRSKIWDEQDPDQWKCDRCDAIIRKYNPEDSNEKAKSVYIDPRDVNKTS